MTDRRAIARAGWPLAALWLFTATTSCAPGGDEPNPSALLAPPSDMQGVEGSRASGRDSDGDGERGCADEDCASPCVVSGCSEQCNGVDDDEDSFVDEGCACPFAGRTQGVCVFGVLTVAPDLRCSTPPGYQSDESSCDGVDNDCDGAVDEGCACRFQDLPAGVCLGAIRLPNGVCGRPPAFEFNEVRFDGLDNDCDGSVDEGSMRCDFMGSSQGLCLYGRPGASADECMAPAGFTDDEDSAWCDGADNDCDGAVDEGCSCFFETRTVGVCLYGVRDGQGGCSPPADHEALETRCDGVDNDCDGEVDEGCTRCVLAAESEVINRSVGVCGASFIRDSGVCVLPDDFEASETRCDGRDNDCDGVTDEGCSCDLFDKPFGECAGAGARDERGVCTTDTLPAVSPRFESFCADGEDNDCDGFTDCEDEDCAGVGGCPLNRLRETTCLLEDDENMNGVFGCEDRDCRFHPQCRFGEICGNGVDDDGDGLIDCADVAECVPERCLGEAGYQGGRGCEFKGDEDSDGLVGCEDPDCFGRRGCTDSACARTDTCRDPDAPEDCNNSVDDDGDGRVDCDDGSCARSPACARGERFCSDGLNDDRDELEGMPLIDCEDPDCFDAPACRR